MLSIKNILFPTDFSRCSAQALAHGLFMAKYYGARLHMIHAIVLHQEDPHNPAHRFPDPKELHEKMANERMNSDLRACTESAKEADIVMEEPRGFSATEVILEYAAANDMDMIVMGTHGRRGLGYMFLGSVAQEVVREASCPVYTVRESENPKSLKKNNVILSPVDFSDHSQKALSVAKEMAIPYNARLKLLHVIEDRIHPAFYASGKESILEINPGIIEHSRKAMNQMFKETPGPDIPAQFEAVAGHVVNEILKYVHSNSIDLIVIATHGLSGLKHLLLGSVAEKVIRKAPCPVLTVKAFGKPLV